MPKKITPGGGNPNGPVKGFLSNTGKSGLEGSYDWGTVEANELARLIQLVTGRGGAIRFGYSRDGNAGSIGVYYGDDRDTVYIRPGQDFSDATGVITRTFESFPYTGGKSPNSGG